MRKMMTKRGLAILTVMVIPTAPLPALAQSLFDSGSTGADGALDLTGQAGDVVIDMNDHPDGIYNYTTVSIPVDVVLKFISNAANTPVTWLASGDIVVDGTVFLRGGDGHGESGQEYSIPGPGGFAGGGRLSTIGASVGLGPGGGSGGTDGDSAGGSYATAGAGNVITYGNRFLLPLIGGSGSGSAFSVSTGIHIGGGAGGGAILIASSTRIVVNGSINADGGNGPYSVTAGLGGNGGSGGAIRLVSNEVAGIGMLSAQGGLNAGFARTGGEGRIRIEAFARVFSGSSTPAAFFSAPLFVQPPNVPTLKATMVDTETVPTPPNGNVFANPDVFLNADQAVNVVVEATNIPVGSLIELRVAGEGAASQPATSSPLQGTFSLSTATATVAFPPGLSHVTMRVMP